jgi:hypothetical protein
VEYQPKHEKEHSSANHSRHIDDTYVFDASAGIYKPKTIETEEERARKQAGTNRRARFFTDPRTDWRPITIATLLSLLTIALLAATVHYAHLQWQRMDRAATAAERASKSADSSAQTADKTLRIAYRPWVNAESAELAEPLVNPPPARFHVKLKFTFKNTGTSVSTDGVAIANLVSEETTLTESETICGQLDQSRIPVDKNMRPRATGFVLAPGNVLHQPIGMWSEKISDQQAMAGHFYIIGCLIYRDQFKAWHHTKFCFRPSGPTTDTKTTFEICDVYQEAD